MGAARRLCVRAVVLVLSMGTLLSAALPGCQFPEYGMAPSNGGSADASTGGTGEAEASAGAEDGGDAGSAGDGGTGGSGNGGSGGDAGEPSLPCPSQACVPRAPKGWDGPLAFWEGSAAEALPACPRGYAMPINLHRDLNAPAGTCACTCGAQGQVCEATATFRIFSDLACGTECAAVVPQACSAVANCTGSQGSVRSVPPTPSGGSCQAHVTGPAPAAWNVAARICLMGDTGTCNAANQTCAPAPTTPYNAKRCVKRVVGEGLALPVCPDEYPNPREPLYASFVDDRGCSACGCSAISGGSCSGKFVLNGASECGPNFDYVANDLCKPFNLGTGSIVPTHVSNQYAVVPGTCSVPSPSHATGSAAPNGDVTVVCCQ